MSQKPTIAFVTGGYSGEAEISYKSAITIEKNLDPQKFNVYKNTFYNNRKRLILFQQNKTKNYFCAFVVVIKKNIYEI